MLKVLTNNMEIKGFCVNTTKFQLLPHVLSPLMFLECIKNSSCELLTRCKRRLNPLKHLHVCLLPALYLSKCRDCLISEKVPLHMAWPLMIVYVAGSLSSS